MSGPLVAGVRSAYSLAMRVAQPLLLRKLRRRGQAEPGYLEAIPERLGRYAHAAPAPEVGAVWIHAVSLGETRAADVLLRALRAREPGLRVLLTHGTATGRAEGARLLAEGDRQAWLPWDTPQAVNAFLDHFRPAVGVLMETEVWPNLVDACARRGIPLALANARLSAASLAGARRLAWLSRPAYGSLTTAWAQTDADAQRLRLAGVSAVTTLGNLKFDASPDPQALARGRDWRERLDRPVLMFASTREGEEDAWLRAAAPFAPGERWLLVPRHPQRFDEVERLLQSRGLRVSRRCQWPEQGPDDAARLADVWLGDSLGEMGLYYGLSDLALLGGSFAPLGGQNLIEAAACGCPLVMGPHTFNFAEAASLASEAGAACRVTDLAEGIALARRLANEPSRRREMAEAGLRFASQHRGAAVRTAEAVLALRAA